MTDYVSDTHALIWYLTNSPRLGSKARAAFEACDQGEAIIYVPPISLVEMVYLIEKVMRDDIPDLPDRIIAATALSLKLPLITRGKNIQLSGLKTIW